MGGNNVKGLKMMETIYPSPNGQSVIPQEKLDKEIRKGTIKADDPNAEKDLDGDMDERIDQCIKEVWSYYDPKGTGILPKKNLGKILQGRFGDLCFTMWKKIIKRGNVTKCQVWRSDGNSG